MFSPKYAFITAYLKGEEAKVITSGHVDKMFKASTIPDALAVIAGTDIGDYLGGVAITTFDDLDEHLWQYLGDFMARMEAFKLLPQDILRILRAYIVKYDVLNIKAALHGIRSGKKASMIPLGVIHNCGLLDELYNAESVAGIIKLLTECRLGDYASVVEAGRADEAEPSLVTEARLDREYYKNLLNMAQRVKDGFVLTRAFGLIIDLTNLQIVSRAVIRGMGPEVAEYTIGGGYMTSRKVIEELLSLKLTEMPDKWRRTLYYDVAEAVLSSYDRTKSITSVNEIIDGYKFSLVRDMLSPRVLSPVMIGWHLILKELEIRNLRLMLKAMFDNISLEEIRQYLVLPS